MNKHILLSLLIMSPAFMHAMEKESASLNPFSLRSFLPARPHQVHHKSKLSDLRKSKNNFEKQLKNKEKKQEIKRIGKMQETQPSIALHNSTINEMFLYYCYYQKFHTNIITVYLDYLDTALVKKGQKSFLNGYSALGAAMIAKDTSIDERRNLIQILAHYDFKLSVKDIELAELILYDNTVKYQKTFLHLSHNQPQANWSVLPQEIRKHITEYILQLLRKEFWLLPETTSTNL